MRRINAIGRDAPYDRPPGFHAGALALAVVGPLLGLLLLGFL